MDWTLGEIVATVLRHAVVSVACVFIATVFLRWAARRKRDRNGPSRPG